MKPRPVRLNKKRELYIYINNCAKKYLLFSKYFFNNLLHMKYYFDLNLIPSLMILLIQACGNFATNDAKNASIPTV